MVSYFGDQCNQVSFLIGLDSASIEIFLLQLSSIISICQSEFLINTILLF